MSIKKLSVKLIHTDDGQNYKKTVQTSAVVCRYKFGLKTDAVFEII